MGYGLRMRIMVTGGAGFIGSHLILRWAQQRSDDRILNLDLLTYASDPRYLRPLGKNPNYELSQIDIGDREGVRRTIQKFRPDGVIHLAAESHVDNSISGPEIFVRTNVLGTFNLLEECLQLWKKDPATFAEKRFLHVSTDEVYGTLDSTGSFTEESLYRPNSPYSATKAGSDHLVRSYHHTFGMNVVTSHCSNNYGPHQHDEKLIPTVIRKAIRSESIPIYGKGENVRDWLFVEDHCAALEIIFDRGRAGEDYNIGGKTEWKNLELVKKICDLLDVLKPRNDRKSYHTQISFVSDRPGHDHRYAIDAAKISRELKWEPAGNFDQKLSSTVEWFLEKYRENGVI
jgi:dTDP-glucose 4,6-dehydratase